MTLRRGIPVLVSLSLGLALGSVAEAAGATSSNRAHKDLVRSLASAREAGSARISVHFFAGATNGRVVQDSSLNSGKQTVAINKELASVVLMPDGSAFISGNSQGLTSFFALPASMLPALVGRWASVVPSDSVYRGVTGNVTLQSALANVTPSGPLVEGKRTKVDGQWVRSILGSVPGGGGRLILFVNANKRSLPVEAIESGGSSRGEIVTFSHWGEQVSLDRPSQSVPFSALEAAASAK